MNTFSKQHQDKFTSLNVFYRDEIRKYKEEHNLRLNNEDFSLDDGEENNRNSSKLLDINKVSKIFEDDRLKVKGMPGFNKKNIKLGPSTFLIEN